MAKFVIKAIDKYSGQVFYWSSFSWVSKEELAKKYKSRKIAESIMSQKFSANSYDRSVKSISVEEVFI